MVRGLLDSAPAVSVGSCQQSHPTRLHVEVRGRALATGRPARQRRVRLHDPQNRLRACQPTDALLGTRPSTAKPCSLQAASLPAWRCSN